MIRDITQNEIILLAYNELPSGRHAEIMRKVTANKELKAEYDAVLADMKILDGAFVAPNITSIEIIKEQSSSSSLEMI